MKAISRSLLGHKGHILNFYKYGCVVYRNEQIGKNKYVPTKEFDLKGHIYAISMSFWGHKGQILYLSVYGCVFQQKMAKI